MHGHPAQLHVAVLLRQSHKAEAGRSTGSFENGEGMDLGTSGHAGKGGRGLHWAGVAKAFPEGTVKHGPLDLNPGSKAGMSSWLLFEALLRDQAH